MHGSVPKPQEEDEGKASHRSEWSYHVFKRSEGGATVMAAALVYRLRLELLKTVTSARLAHFLHTSAISAVAAECPPNTAAKVVV